MGQIWLIQIAGHVIPLPLPASSAQNMDTLLCMTVWLPTRPRRILASRWTVVNPVELIVSLSVKPKPRTPICNRLLLLRQIKHKFIFIRRSDYGEVSSQILAISSSVAPFQGWNIDDVEAWLSMKIPTSWTRRPGDWNITKRRTIK